MEEFLSKFNGGQLIGLIAVVGGILLSIISVVATQWRRVRIAKMENNFKRQMLEKGIPISQIEQIAKANGDSACVLPTGNENADKAALAQRMVENGYESEDIERVLRAFQPARSTTDKSPAASA